MTRLLYVGNFQPDEPHPWSTETHVAASFELEGHQVVRLQETEGCWQRVPSQALEAEADLVLWTRTWGLDRDLGAQAYGLLRLRREGVPTAALHLDKFWDLPRAEQLRTEPWFSCSRVFTADGGNQARFAALGIDHVWLPPAVYGPECALGLPQPELQAEVGFVGSYRNYHPEWVHRRHLVDQLRGWYGNRLALWPKDEQVRGPMLADLYASLRVLVGDSCMVGGTGRYWSDRIPETLGRGGFLLHPYTEGLELHYTPGEHLVCWELGKWQQLRAMVDRYLEAPDERQRIAAMGRAHVLDHHTYQVRARQLLGHMGLA